MTFAYQRDPCCRTLRAQILRSDVDGGRPYVVLSDTVLRPAGGGQPCDRGSINGVLVDDVAQVGGEARHYLAAPLPVGPAEIELDWARRFDYMQQHTAQHLLTAIAEHRFGWATTAFHLGETLSDVELNAHPLARRQLDDLEQALAAEVRAARPVTVHDVARERLPELAVRSRRPLPGGAGTVRLVEISGLDLNPCGGSHVPSTAELELIKLLDAEPLRGGTRLHFVAGGRARRRLAVHEDRCAALRRLLDAPDPQLVDSLTAKLEQLRDALQRVRRLESALVEEAVRQLAARRGALIVEHWPDRDGDFLQRVARSLGQSAPDKIALLTAGVAEDGCFVLLAGESVRLDLGAAAREVFAILSARGGGRGRTVQGRAAALGRREAAAAALARLVGRQAGDGPAER